MVLIVATYHTSTKERLGHTYKEIYSQTTSNMTNPMRHKTITTKHPVTLVGFQAIMKPSRYGHLIQFVTDELDLIDELEDDRIEFLEGLNDRIENPRTALLRPAPWIPVGDDFYNIKSAWREHNCPPVIDSRGNEITDPDFPIYSGSQCILSLYQIPYLLKDKMTYGTAIKIAGIQVIELGNGTSVGDVLSLDQARQVFGVTYNA